MSAARRTSSDYFNIRNSLLVTGGWSTCLAGQELIQVSYNRVMRRGYFVEIAERGVQPISEPTDLGVGLLQSRAPTAVAQFLTLILSSRSTAI
jgi:hypothetical protein